MEGEREMTEMPLNLLQDLSLDGRGYDSGGHAGQAPRGGMSQQSLWHRERPASL